MENVPFVVNSACPSPHLPEDPGTSTRHIRLSTPPSSPHANSPEMALPSSVLRRVRTRPEDPSSLAILAAVCSSPSVRWDGVKHQYGEGHGKSIWCEDLRRAHEPSPQTHFVDPPSPITASTHGDHPLAFPDTIKEEMDNYRVGGTPKFAVADEMHCPAVEDDDEEDIPAPRLPPDQYYFSEFPSSPPTLVFSSPSNRFDYSSSSERSSTLPLSSPGLPYQRKTTLITSLEPLQGADMNDGSVHASTPQEYSSSRVLDNAVEADCMASISEGHVSTQAIKEESKASQLEVLLTDCEPTCTPSLSPVQAPEPLPLRCLDLSFSPLSSLMSSPLSEVMEEGPSSPTASRFSVISEVLSSRSTSPDMDMIDTGSLVKLTSRRASANVAGTRARRMSGLSSHKRWQRSDTAPPETTPSKRPRQPSPPSPVSRHHSSFSRSRSPRSNSLTTSSIALEENQHIRKKQKRKTQTRRLSTTSKGNRTIERSQPSASTGPRHPPKSNKGKSTHRRPDTAVTDLPSPSQLTALPVTGFLVETLALSRASAIAAPELLRAVLKSQPHLMEERSEKLWLDLVRCILEQVPMFGRIERRGTDAADRPLEDQWFYIPENDDENGRAELLKGLMPKKRNVTKRSKQYYFEPVQKVSRWDPEDE